MDDIDELVRKELERIISNSTETARSSRPSPPPVQPPPVRPPSVQPPPVQPQPVFVQQPEPTVEIVEQPMPFRRFRYDSEIQSAGAIQGVRSTKDIKSFPKIKIGNYEGPAEITVSLVCKDKPYRVHPNGIVDRKKSTEEDFTYIHVKRDQVTSNNCVIPFNQLGIRLVRPSNLNRKSDERNQIEEALQLREEQNVDPFGQGFSHKFDPKSIDLEAVRLCFQVKLAQERKLDPVVSDIIYHHKNQYKKNSTLGCLQIIKMITMCRSCGGCASNTRGPKVIFLSKPQQLNPNDLAVVFYKEENEKVVWEHCVRKFDISDTSGIVCEVPAYPRASSEVDTEVKVVLKRPSDGTCGAPWLFTYYADADAVIKRKRKNVNKLFQDLQDWTPPASLPPEPDYVSKNDQDWRKMPGPFDDNPTMPGPSSINPAVPKPISVKPAGPGPCSLNASISRLNHFNSAVPRPSHVNPVLAGPSSVNVVVPELNHGNSAKPQPSQVSSAVAGPSFINSAMSGSNHDNSAIPRPSSVNPAMPGPNYVESAVPGPSFINPAVSGWNDDNSAVPGPSFINPAVSGSNHDISTVPTPSSVNPAMPGPNAGVLRPNYVRSAVPEPSFVNSALPGLNYVNLISPEPTEWGPMLTDQSMSPDIVPTPSISQPMTVIENEGLFSPNGHLDNGGENPDEDSALADICYNLIIF